MFIDGATDALAANDKALNAAVKKEPILNRDNLLLSEVTQSNLTHSHLKALPIHAVKARLQGKLKLNTSVKLKTMSHCRFFGKKTLRKRFMFLVRFTFHLRIAI